MKIKKINKKLGTNLFIQFINIQLFFVGQLVRYANVVINYFNQLYHIDSYILTLAVDNIFYFYL